MPSQEQRTQLRNILAEHFDEEDLRTLCFDLGVRYDDLGGRSNASNARELVDFMERNGRLAELVTEGRKQRPKAPWPAIDESEPGALRFPIDNIPCHHNLSFTGRKDHLQTLAQALQQPTNQLSPQLTNQPFSSSPASAAWARRNWRWSIVTGTKTATT
ncbi:MAG TPA: effector-associated domain EAD1-containing protein [Anaerolineae bacterium]